MKKTPKSPDNEPKRLRELVMESQFTEDLQFWIEIDRKLALRIMDLVKEIVRDPFNGIGKPERLKYFRDNTWSRRINQGAEAARCHLKMMPPRNFRSSL